MASIPNLFGPTVQRALPLSKGADLRMSIFDDSTNPPQPWPSGTKGVLEIDYAGATTRFDTELVNGRLELVLGNELTDDIPATTASNKVAWRLRVAFADDPTVEIAVYEGPVYRNRHG